MIEFKNIVKKFQQKIAVDSINLKISDGDFLGIIGQNGAGKSTSIKMIIGELLPDSGEILWNGFPLNPDNYEHKKGIFYIPQKPLFYEYLTAQEYLEFIGSIYKVENPKDKIDKFLTQIDLEIDKNRLLIEYSEGMIKKVMLGAALLSDANLLILDEVFAGLDPVAIYHFKSLLLEVVSKNKTIIFASHILESIEQLCSRVIIMKSGKILEECDKKRIDDIKIEYGSLEEYYIQKVK
ncbi:ABC transporter ATP-binding protein [bacterium]|nr:ABC transporter ATP-binding protein [bacterium]